MDYVTLGNTSLQVSKVCLGTMTYGDQNTQQEANQQLDFALSQGINFIDTAEMYPVPPKAETVTRTETILGNWIKTQTRDQFILASKIAGPRRGMHWIRGGPSGLDRDNIRAAVHDSLARLQTDYLDLYYLHWPERNVPMFGQYQFDPKAELDKDGNPIAWVSIQTQLEALDELIQEGKIRAIGLSNEQPWGLMEFLRIAKERNLPRVAALQNCYNLMNRGMEFGMTEVLYREGVSLMAYSPLAFGHLTGKYVDDPLAVGRVTQFLGYAQRYKKPGVPEASRRYAELARAHNLTATQLALSFVMHRWFVASTIIGATNMQQLEHNIAAYQTKLSDTVLSEIEQIHLTMMNPAP
ncbi:MAG: NADP(H)-dependent aldo-keto reductase [Methylophilaceae bacterium 17-44-8]|jgi:aryl-alcohol dehydrogenase-like predicted oxidoreductase|nr:MAG: NADP(H)-dependent aldo-keto reductase [Methylophilales bacterium 28-44-11]OYZ10120.1 MAG: NADP(H)-dependent aldo-keto reductase [Methylophilales bacterium 16-45-7]OZA06513.1 MAG: NADP(H)-dependent aldo-keto reductase [Methylophilaceae bacterium 17-44-8]